MLTPKTFIIILTLALTFSPLAYAASLPAQKVPPKPVKIILPPPIKLSWLKVNPPVRIKKASTQVLAGIKLPNSAVYINNKLVILANKYTSWYYEYPLTLKSNKVIISPTSITSISQLRNAIALNLDTITTLDVDAPRIFGYRLDPQTKDFLFNIQDPPGVLSYNIYYANSLSGSLAASPFILAQANVPVSGTGTTTWRDNGTYTGSHPSKVAMRFYRIEINRVDTINPIIIISSPQEGEAIED